MTTLEFVDSHTEGEPTRALISGVPDLGEGSVAERKERLAQEFDWVRTGSLLEPRGSEVLVGALLLPSSISDCVAGVIFFNNVGYLGMCGHGLIGVVETLRHLGRIQPGECRIETPVGVVSAVLAEDRRVQVTNVPSYRTARGISVRDPEGRAVVGDVAWGGNWFFLVSGHGKGLDPKQCPELTRYALALRDAVRQAGFPEVDHVELFGPPQSPEADSRNFVLCPGGAFDRSPCGTGTSAKLACLAAEGVLEPGARWVQESVVGGRFEGSYQWQRRDEGWIIPTIEARAFVTASGALEFDPEDPFRTGFSVG